MWTPTRRQLLAAFVSVVVASCLAPAPLLNSERIAQRFGSYGIEVLESDGVVRVSNLYSLEGDQKICRTFAVVRYPAEIDPLFATEHDLILGGQSIGAVFVQNGWTVNKSHRYFGEVSAAPAVAELMGGVQAPRLAIHIYVLEVVKGDAAFEYAAIAEVHHPDYLTLSELQATNGDGQDVQPNEDDLVGQMLELTGEKMGSNTSFQVGRLNDGDQAHMAWMDNAQKCRRIRKAAPRRCVSGNRSEKYSRLPRPQRGPAGAGALESCFGSLRSEGHQGVRMTRHLFRRLQLDKQLP
jgi:hypothetical protein